ncbi:two component transcriptional regulator, LuxR family [Actinomadura meyerae]|jgi:DNA-binding NarL/FixJ family response regulator|uniref:Two component transcriptional regulator, LuxR family n=1 Tax=Actinomadura meyerae TaxID=240840 RepID=A0A239KBE0_9ACTN|nr:response regulator transcription factor [Actinomadura meyerae]SNT15727.1 two component transcriptional regulator, LuxR family [Actinomadura meyerae]
MRVAVAEDSGIFRQALVTLLTTVGIEVVASAGSGEELLARVAGDPPDVVIVDLHMPPTFTSEGVVAARRLLERHPGIGVLVLSAYNETPQAMELFRDQPRGVGYLLKDHVTDVDSLRSALERVMRGEVVIDPDVVSRLVEARHREAELSRLSGREREVLALMAEGHSNAGIGRRLHLSARTVEDHVRAIFTKLKIASSGGAPGPQDANKRVLAVLTWLRAAETR